MPLARAVDEILGCVQGIPSVVWNVGSSAQPPGLPERLLALGLRDPDPPLDPVAVAMVLTEEPPSVGGVEVRRIETLDDHLIGLEIMLAADAWSAEAIADERARAAETYERRVERGGSQWLAYLDGKPVAWATAERATAGLFLGGGATLARGAWPRLLPGARAGTLGRGRSARPTGARGPGPARVLRTDPATPRLRRGRHDPHLAVVTRAPSRTRSPRSPPTGSRSGITNPSRITPERKGAGSRRPPNALSIESRLRRISIFTSSRPCRPCRACRRRRRSSPARRQRSPRS